MTTEDQVREDRNWKVWQRQNRQLNQIEFWKSQYKESQAFLMAALDRETENCREINQLREQLGFAESAIDALKLELEELKATAAKVA